MRMRRRLGVPTALAVSLIFVACGVTDIDSAEFSGGGTIRFVDVEGGCWAIESDIARYEPTNLDDSFRVDGLYVTFRAVARPDRSSICQVGRLIEIVEMGVPED